MEIQEIQAAVQAQNSFFFSGKTRPYPFRAKALDDLLEAVRSGQDRLLQALESDLNKPRSEGYMTEVGLALAEIKYARSHLRRWMKTRRVPSPLAQIPSRSYICPEPFGTVLIMAPWNYPVLLCLQPLAAAIAAGNTVVLKPSAYAPATSAALAQIISTVFPPEYVTVIQGGRAENTGLLEQKFDFIFFTGSPSVGHLVMSKASEHLTPVCLELGGKSPVIVDETTDLQVAARRIAFGKTVNAGQTCVAPDYLLIAAPVKERFISFYEQALREFFPDGDYSTFPCIINDKHFGRVTSLIDPAKVVIGGRTELQRRFIEPTVMDNVSWDDPVMGQEIFGPVLPVITYDNLDEALNIVASRPKPLALYLFTADARTREKVLSRCSFGGGCINDTLVHLSSEHLPFGGVGNSGMGSYHGKQSFMTFTHYRSILERGTWLDIRMRYRPYTRSKEKLLRKFLG
ncbi:MAG: aldehyde dehydrogenase [Spirochaetales bacterium]|nr:aldehyde dehydrogenase [Spirochaetales bacterium]